MRMSIGMKYILNKFGGLIIAGPRWSCELYRFRMVYILANGEER